jgi:hypothetical protein
VVLQKGCSEGRRHGNTKMDEGYTGTVGGQQALQEGNAIKRYREKFNAVTDTSCRGAAGCIYCAYESTDQCNNKVGLRNPSHVPPRNKGRTVQVVSLLVALQVTRTRAEVGNHRKDGRLSADRCSSQPNDKRLAFRAGRRLPQPWPKYWNEWSAFAGSQMPREVQE